ncbi:MAG: DUF1700 domain-containing protein [Lachnospiraceae bacterium]
MDKNTFMRELERSLSVLQESELRDILSEYEQHIDMKVKSGLSEEEAIEDFGSLPELTAEILEAYHVRADYGPGQRGGDGRRTEADGRSDGGGSGEGQGSREKERQEEDKWKTRASRAGKKTAGFFSELGRRALRLARRTGRWFSGVFIFWRELLGRHFRRFSRFWKQKREERLYRTDGSMEMEKAGKKRGNAGVSLGRTAGSFGRRLAGMAKRCFNSLIRLTAWTARLFWNGVWIFLAGCMGGTGLMFLFCLGVLAVLMVQGYPVAGVTLGCLGVTMSLFSAAGLGMTLLWKKQKKGPGAVSQWENGEAEEEAFAGTEAAGEENRAESWKESQEENREETWKVNQEEKREEGWKESQTDIPAEPEHGSGCRKEGGQYA